MQGSIHSLNLSLKSPWKTLYFAGCWRHQGQQERDFFPLHGELVRETLCLKTTPSYGGFLGSQVLVYSKKRHLS